MTQHELSQLVDKYLSGQATEQDKQLLNEWYNSYEEPLTVAMATEKGETETGLEQKMLAKLQQYLASQEESTPSISRSKPAKTWFRIAASIMMFVLVAGASYFYFFGKKSDGLIYTFEDEENEQKEAGHDKYDGAKDYDVFEAERTKDPALGYVPYDRLYDAIMYTKQLKEQLPQQRLQQSLLWEERGPIYDSLGPSNGNTRAGVNYTSGRIIAFLVDTLNDPSGNTVITGGVAGGLWRCNNFLSLVPNWQSVDDYMDNLAISSLCQDPTSPNVMYMSTGEPTSNADAVFGKGIWKSTNAGLTWTMLPSTANFIRTFRVMCDKFGNVYVGARTTATPASQTAGLLRSKDGGATWTNITPTAQGTATATATCTDIEIAKNGKMYCSFGYLGSVVRPYVTNDPAAVTQTTGWTLGTGVRLSAVAALRMELAAIEDTVYAITINSAYNADSCYKSIDGGVNWTKQNTTLIPTGLGSGQGWYNITLAINPANTSELMSGGLDAYRSVNGGATWALVTNWVSTAPYVHADHHYMQWWRKNGESRLMIACDGGLFLSRDNGASWSDKNRNLGIKQFYAGAIHPAAGSPYLIAGAQDNGTHQLKYSGLGPSNEVVGGDGCFVHINQLDPSVQFGSYVYNAYRRSTNGGQTWSTVNINANTGLFVNPFDYDDAANTMYASSGGGMYRWLNANTTAGTTAVQVTINALGGSATAFKVSPYTPNRVFIGSSGGRVLKIDNANTVVSADVALSTTDLTAVGMSGNVSCVNTGSNDNNLVIVMSNYGVSNVWVSSNGGTSWTVIDGNLPDMPVRWALFEPGRNDRMILATEAGIYSTDLINGASTLWVPNTTFPTVRTDMLKMRTSDSTIVAATHGRGLYTAKIPAVVLPYVTFITQSAAYTEASNVTAGCRSYADYKIGIGMVNQATGTATVNLNVVAGATATRGVDYDFTTNGSFTSPSSSIVYTAGQTGVRYITLRIYDDTQVEPVENFSLNFTVSGTTDAVPGLLTSFSASIADNDRNPVPYVSSSFAIGTFNTDLTASTTPFEGTKLKHRLQVLYTATELRAAGISINASFSSMKIRVKTKNTTKPFNGFTISIANTTSTTLAAGYAAGSFTTVYTGNYSSVVGDNTFAFSTPFNWDGVSNVVVQYCYDNFGGTAEAAGDVVEGMATPLGAGIRASVYSNWTTSTAAGCAIAAALVNDARVNATFVASFGDPVATALNSTRSSYLGASADVYYYNASNEILARVLNLSSFDYGCTDVTIDRSGTGTTQFWNTNPANYLMNKVFKVIPTTNSATGKYEVTFYFTKAEKEGWEAATARSWNDIQIIKVPSRISNVTPLNAQPDGAGTVQVINAVRRTFGPDYYTLTAIFENGFSSFGFGIPERMNTILTLSGSMNANNKDIDLTWTTSAEINSSVFIIEKSYDGVNYHSIGNKTAAGNKLTSSSYNFTDPENVQYNYYRIKMLHTDGYVLYSNVVFIKKDNAPQQLFVYPNPFAGDLNIRFSRNPVSSVSFGIYDAGGKLVKKFTAAGGLPVYNLNTSDIIPRGVYVLKVVADGKDVSKRIIKQ
jgi:hypothetical protein